MRIFTLLVFLGISQNAFSQADFREAYIITMEEDTLEGLVNYRPGSGNYTSCEFKKNEHGEIISHGPYQLKGYRFKDDKYFESKDILVDEDRYERIFMEVLEQGSVSLYQSPEAFYVQKNDTIFHRLLGGETEEYIDGKRVIRENTEYLGILKYLMFDCPEVRENFGHQNIYLTEKNLTKLIERYNSCMGEKSVSFKEKKPWFNPAIGIAAGISSSQIKFTTDLTGYQHLTNNFDRSYSLMTGLNFELNSPRLNERLALYAGIFYLATKYQSFSTVERGSYHRENNVKINLKQLQAPLGLRYTFPKRNFTPYINLGVSGTFHLETSSSYLSELKLSSGSLTEEEEAIQINKNQFGYWGGIGVKKQMNKGLILFAEIRYEKTNGINGYEKGNFGMALFAPSISSRVQNIQVLIGLML